MLALVVGCTCRLFRFLSSLVSIEVLLRPHRSKMIDRIIVPKSIPALWAFALGLAQSRAGIVADLKLMAGLKEGFDLHQG